MLPQNTSLVFKLSVAAHMAVHYALATAAYWIIFTQGSLSTAFMCYLAAALLQTALFVGTMSAANVDEVSGCVYATVFWLWAITAGSLYPGFAYRWFPTILEMQDA